mgnify:CR=1 FL=1
MTLADKKNTQLKKAIIKLVAFFDLFDYPLTSGEVWRYLELSADYEKVKKALQSLDEKMLQSGQGFYFLKDREEIVEIRQRRFNYARSKIKRARRIARVFRCFPGVEMVAVSNIIGEYNLKKESDIDLLIITEKGKLWSVRFFTVLLTKLLGLRPKPGKEKDKICLSFFLTPACLNLDYLRLRKDIYFTYWMAGLEPVFNRNHAYENFIQANSWLPEELPNWKIKKENWLRKKNKFISFFLNLFAWESLWKKIQLSFMNPELKEKMNQDTCVVVSDSILKLHSRDRREYYREEFINKLTKYLKTYEA